MEGGLTAFVSDRQRRQAYPFNFFFASDRRSFMLRGAKEDRQAGCSYEYASLSSAEIRLIRLDPPEISSDIFVIGDIEVVTVANAPPYYALSHSWPLKRHLVKVQVNGLEYCLADDLVDCIRWLKALMAHGSDLSQPLRYIWIDSICINQEDSLEISSQVNLMGKIYTQSIRTLIWLGPGTFSAAWQLLDHISDMSSEQSTNTTEDHYPIPLRIYTNPLHQSIGLPPWHDFQWEQLRQLMHARWFARVWVIQEVALSPQDPLIFTEGGRTYPWSRLSIAATWMRKNGYLRLSQVPERLKNIDTMANLRRSKSLWSLGALISITHVKFNASDQRDKVYGLLGLAFEAQQESHDILRPDYSVDAATVYERVAWFLFGCTRSLALLTRASGVTGDPLRNHRVHKLNLPSWTPDWSDLKVGNNKITTSLSWVHYSDAAITPTCGFPTQYTASSTTRPQLHDTGTKVEGTSVNRQLWGILVDQVSRVITFDIGRYPDDAHCPVFDERMSAILAYVLTHTKPANARSWLESFIRVTTVEHGDIGGRDWDQSVGDGLAYLRPILKRRQSLMAHFESPSGESELGGQFCPSSDEGVAEQYLSLVHSFCFGRAFIITTNGRMGVGPSNTQQGDTISVIHGGGVPYLLRGHQDLWSFVGESYIDGLMKGEAIQDCQHDVFRKRLLSLQ